MVLEHGIFIHFLFVNLYKMNVDKVKKPEKTNGPSEKLKMLQAKGKALNIFNRIKKYGRSLGDFNSDGRFMEYGIWVVKEDGHKWTLKAMTDDYAKNMYRISIEWRGSPEIVQLMYLDNDSFWLKTGKSHDYGFRLSADEVLKILSQFEKRLNQLDQQWKQRKQKTVNRAINLAHQEDQNDADKLLENYLA